VTEAGGNVVVMHDAAAVEWTKATATADDARIAITNPSARRASIGR
jgi:hypothetical protein